MVLATPDRPNELWAPGYFKTEEEKNRAPKVEELLGLLREGRDYFKPFHDQCRLEEDYFNGNRLIPHPEGVDPVWPATSYSIVSTATDHVDVNNLEIDVPSPPRGRARAERIKKFYIGAWEAIKQPVLRTAVNQAFLYGIAWLRTMYEADKWPDVPVIDDFKGDEAYREALEAFQDLRDISFPLDVDVIKPTNLIWDDSRGTSPRWALEFYEAPIRDLSRRYREGDLARRYPAWAVEQDNGQRMGQWFMYTDTERFAVVVDREIVLEGRHGYGYMPYTPILPVMSHTFADGRPEERYRGILWHVHSLLDSEARLMTQLEAQVRITAYRTLDFMGPRQTAEEVARDYTLFGGKNVVPPQVTVAASPMIQTNPDIGDQLLRVQNLIESATFPNVVRGMRPKGVSAGFALSIMAGMGRLKFQGVADGLRHAIEQVNGNFARLVENKIKGRITVHARTDIHNFDQSIEPDDIKGMYENTVVVKAEAPEERERESILALKLWNGGDGIITLYEAQKRSGIANPLEEQQLQRAELIMRQPEFIQAQTQLLLNQIGLPQQLAAASAPTLAGGNQLGSQNIGGQQLQRPGEGAIQGQRARTNQQPGVFPQGLSGLDSLGSILGQTGGGAQGVPSGQTIPG
jgi:hypothetical protein